ncbi:hypothetical protein RIF29_26618 [Crotalaria pallida]|uniref:Uncharacterized protein n=1 Tax=Crotalaria pallida TaxID=3830 RepID=A0AAN9ENW6_CROPI
MTCTVVNALRSSQRRRAPVRERRLLFADSNFAIFSSFFADSNAVFSSSQSSNPPFTSVELDHSDSGREGCTVTTLTITAEPKNWHSAIRVSVQEVDKDSRTNLLSIAAYSCLSSLTNLSS